ncbi:extensin-like [Contarinia nasturtii]|uniref:extensin-like n=1 Tax=Contarinia nasturtii TaxID=265458 RepID=UPI0012D37B99|nr:extensin-like [Contarinia nasturtii]XP_031622249.1 extensin-like [Contarinia nasturtii]
MYRILIACALAIQVQSRPFGTFFFGGRATPILPWLPPSPSPIAPSPQYPTSGIFDTIRLHQNVYAPFSRYLHSSFNPLRPAPQFPPRIYGRLETPPILSYQQFFGPSSTAPSFIPSNGFNSVDQHNEFAPPNNQFPADPFGSNNGPQFAPSPYAGTQPPVFGQPHQVYGPPPPNTFNPANGIVNRFEPSNPNYNLQGQSPFQLQPGTQLPVAPFATNVLPLIPHISSPGTTYLPPATVNQKDSTQKVDTSSFTTPTTPDSETNANEPQTDSTKLPTVMRDGTQTTQEGTSVSSVASEAATTESTSTTVQLSESTAGTSSTTLGSTDAESTDSSESTAISNKTTAESSSTEPAPTEPSSTEASSTEPSSTEPSSTEPSLTDSATDDESNAV